MPKKVVALVPLRGGSKSIPLKNIKHMAGRPLCYWVLKAAVDSDVFCEVFVSTESEEIAKVVEGLGLGVKVHPRPPQFALDHSGTEEVMLDFAASHSFDVLCLIQATSPLTTGDDFRAAWKHFVNQELDSMLTAVRTKRFFWHDNGTAINYDPLHRPRRQDFRGTLMENGAFYFTKYQTLEQFSCRLGGKIGIYEMQPEHAVELDEPEDWLVLERLLLARERAALTKIRLFVTDIDGVMTDGSMYYSEAGDELKRFNTRDGMGLQMIKSKGIKVGIITGENRELNRRRAEKLQVDFCVQGSKEKLNDLQAICAQYGVALSEVAYIGDDINDAEVLAQVGIPACPSDAHPVVRGIPGVLVLENAGGRGAVREFCDLILAGNLSKQ